ncbi:MAG TPA: flagellar basal body rod protein FlgC [Sedimentisphaerales bacterium]|nr:flagellar basal body rod protein FlgC [Sedimentisphaerales bacterium]
MEVNNVFGPLDIAVSGLRAQNKQMEVITSNIANARTSDAGKGEPYRRLEAIFKTEAEGVSGVALDKIVKDTSEFYRIFEPGHPNADEQGYVAMPNVNLPMEMINLNIATRAYQANAAILKRYQQMVETTLELLR